MIPKDYIGKRVRHGSHFARVMGVVEGNVLAIEYEDPQFDEGSRCSYQGRTYVPSGRGTWVRYNDSSISLAEEDNEFTRGVRSYIEKELKQ